MSISPDSPWRGCAAAYPQPVDDERAAQFLQQTVYNYNCRMAASPLDDIIYRSSDGEEDVTRRVFRWDTAYYQEIFANGFQARRREGTPDETYFDLNHYVHHGGGRPLDSTRPSTHAFVSTTLSSQWRPNITLGPGDQIEVYRYEIYAPGGIWVRETLGDLYRYPAQDEVAFVAGIARQYVRSAQLFTATGEAKSRFPRWSRADRIIRLNGRFNPQSHPSRSLRIQRPVFDYRAENGTSLPLSMSTWIPRATLLSVSDTSASDWYAGGVADSPSYINAAFRSSVSDEAYLFMKNEYVALNYAPGSTDDFLVNGGPHRICDGYPSLAGTAFGEHGVDCAFDCDRGNEALIFSGNLCARFDYAPGTRDGRILDGPMPITAMFPFFSRTVFAGAIDAAFPSTASNEAYLFKGDSYALINYESKTCMGIHKITQGFHSLGDTIFQSGLDAAFASHRMNQAYIFKGDQYALINFVPGSNDDYIVGGVKPIAPNWPSLRGMLPRPNRGLDDHAHRNQAQPPDRGHDEL
ncbi:hypothetical protein ABZP36_018912 [Zizania latifolia]